MTTSAASCWPVESIDAAVSQIITSAGHKRRMVFPSTNEMTRLTTCPILYPYDTCGPYTTTQLAGACDDLVAPVESIDASLESLWAILEDGGELSSCENINGKYQAAVYDELCDELPKGLLGFWVSCALLTVLLLILVSFVYMPLPLVDWCDSRGSWWSPARYYRSSCFSSWPGATIYWVFFCFD